MPAIILEGLTAGAALADLLRRYGYIRGVEQLAHDGPSMFKAIEIVTDIALASREPTIPLIFRPSLAEPHGDARLAQAGKTLSFLLGQITVVLSRHEFGISASDLHYHDVVVQSTQIEFDGEVAWTLPQR